MTGTAREPAAWKNRSEVVDGEVDKAAEPQFPEGHLTRIGRITVAFSGLEGVTQFLAWRLLGPEQQLGQIVTAELSFRQVRGLCLNLYRRAAGDDDAGFLELTQLMKHAEKLEQRRNEITHSFWTVADDDTQAISRMKLTAKERRGLHMDLVPMSEKDLDGLGKEIKQLAQEVLDFMAAHSGRPPGEAEA